MIERHGNTLKHAQENTQRSEARENVRDHERTRGETIETKQEPEKARVSFFPLLPLFVFPLSSQAHREFATLASLNAYARNYRPTPTQNYTYSIQQRSAIQHRTRHQGTSQATAAAAEHTARSTRHTAQSVQSIQSTKHAPHSAKHTAHSTQHAAQSTQRKAHSTEQTPQNTQHRAHIAQQSTAQSTA